MTHIMHAADLHLTADPDDREYGLGVLDEIITLTNREQADCLILAGDTFNTFADVEQLADEFRTRLEQIRPECRVLAIAGNHEYRDIGGNSLSNRDWGRAQFLHDGRFDLQCIDDVEILAVPHQGSYADYLEWQVPKKVCPTRILVAHGALAGMQFTGSEEEDESVLDPDLFERFHADYVAMGHIHAFGEKSFGHATICYPGSARVWRRGEHGPRRAGKITIDRDITREQEILSRAGQYRWYERPLPLDGSLPEFESLQPEWENADWIDIHLTGVIEREDLLVDRLRGWQRTVESKIRRLRVLRKDVITMEGIAGHSIAKRFLELWKSREPAAGDSDLRTVWLRSREFGLRKIKATLEARS